jgi:predicted transcriptional regulator
MARKSPEEKLLTDTELELMNIIWKLREGTVNDVLRDLPQERDLAYTSVSTILRILEQKKILKARKEGRGHVYVPLVSKSEYEGKTLKHVVDQVFEGAPLSLARQLINTGNLSKNELSELKKMIEKLEGKT